MRTSIDVWYLHVQVFKGCKTKIPILHYRIGCNKAENCCACSRSAGLHRQPFSLANIYSTVEIVGIVAAIEIASW